MGGGGVLSTGQGRHSWGLAGLLLPKIGIERWAPERIPKSAQAAQMLGYHRLSEQSWQAPTCSIPRLLVRANKTDLSS